MGHTVYYARAGGCPYEFNIILFTTGEGLCPDWITVYEQTPAYHTQVSDTRLVAKWSKPAARARRAGSRARAERCGLACLDTPMGSG